MKKTACAVAATAALFGSLGCRQLLGADDFGVAKPGHPDGTCTACVQSHCRKETDACAADPACTALATCLDACAAGDAACRGTCHQSIPETTALRALVACEATSPCDTCGSALAVRGGESCDVCLSRSCGDELSSFSRSRDALELDACLARCQQDAPDCDCKSLDAGRAAQAAIEQCRSGICNDECVLAPVDFGCLGHVRWPAPKADVLASGVDYHLQTTNVVGNPMKAVHVVGCAPLAVDCASDPVGGGDTDVAGWTSIRLPTPGRNQPFFDHFEATGDNVAALLYAYPPPRETPTWKTLRVLARNVADAFAKGPPLDRNLDWGNFGGLAFSVVDCNGNAAPGVRVTIETGNAVYYTSDSSPYPDVTLEETSTTAFGVIIDVPAGTPKLTAVVTSTGEQLFSRPLSVQIGKITHVTIVPSPAQD